METKLEDKHLDKAELHRRLPEIKLIENASIRSQVETAFLNYCPTYFWKVPASSSGKYHQDDVVSSQGLWLHTKRAFTVGERIARSEKYRGNINQEEHDVLRASILLHDMFKQGLEPRDSKHTSDDHDLIVRQFLEREMNIDSRILDCVESHNGGWGEGKNPTTRLEDIHHLADMVGSDKNLIGKVYKPCEEIKETFDVKIFDEEEGGGISADL